MKAMIAVASLALLASVAPGCGSPQKIFKITSWPDGAIIYVDEVQRGQTDMEKLSVDFGHRDQVIVRLAKDGYQSTGRVLKITSDRVQFFPLEQSPDNQKIIETLHAQQRTLDAIQRSLERFLNQMTERSSATGVPEAKS